MPISEKIRIENVVFLENLVAQGKIGFVAASK